MRIVIAGLGGVGGVVGGRLAVGLAGSPEHEVVFWCRGETLSAIKEKGLKVLAHCGEIKVRPSLVTCCADEVKSADLLIFTTKNYHLEAVARELAPITDGKTVALPLLNGVSAGEVLEKQMPQCDVLGGCVYLSAYAESPGIVKQVGPVQRIVFGKKGMDEAENLARYGSIDQILKKSGISVTLTEKVEMEMWSKLVFLSPFAGVTTLFKRGFNEVFLHEESLETVKRMIGEIEALARAKNIDLPENIAETSIEKGRVFPPFTKSSMQMDQENGRQTEIESLIGYVCREGKTLGVPLPTYEKVYNGLKGVCKE
ncbi:MAG: 2-dehydropantoate 2-reductase [Synergistaceae bacterium]|nr:2-dehydropantoate 2-reductase [Synergistaceae bacterium]